MPKKDGSYHTLARTAVSSQHPPRDPWFPCPDNSVSLFITLVVSFAHACHHVVLPHTSKTQPTDHLRSRSPMADSLKDMVPAQHRFNIYCMTISTSTDGPSLSPIFSTLLGLWLSNRRSRLLMLHGDAPNPLERPVHHLFRTWDMKWQICPPVTRVIGSRPGRNARAVRASTAEQLQQL